MEENFNFRIFKKPDDKLDKVSVVILALSHLLKDYFDPIFRDTKLDFTRFSSFIDSGAIHLRVNDILSKNDLFVFDSEIISIVLQEFDIVVRVISKEYPPNIHDQLLSSWYSFKKSDVSKLLSQEIVRAALGGGQPESESESENKDGLTHNNIYAVFRGDQYELIIKKIVDKILTENNFDFDSDIIINEILQSLGIPYNFDEIDNSNFSHKSRLKQRLENKREFIKTYGKIIEEILDYNKNTTMQKIADRYGVNQATISRLVSFLKDNSFLNKEKRFSKHKDWSFLDIDNTGNSLDRAGTLEKLKQYLLNEIMQPEFKKEHNLTDKASPRVEDLDPRFVDAYKRRGFSFEEIALTSGLIPNYQSWDFLDWNESGIPRTYNQALDNAKNFLLNIMSKHKELNFEDGFGPRLIDLCNSEYHSFVSALYSRNLYFNKVLYRAGFKLRNEWGKWAFLDWDFSNIPRSKLQAMKNAASYLIKDIMSDNFIKVCELKPRFAPTVTHLEKYGPCGFIDALTIRSIKYNEVINFANLEKNIEFGKWEFLDWNEEGIPRTYIQALDNAKDYFLSIVYNDELKNSLDLNSGLAPSRDDIFETEHSNFLSALYDRGINYNILVEYSGFNPREFELFTLLGKLLHWVLEFLFLQHTIKNNCISFFEVYTNIKTEDPFLYNQFGRKKIDNAIIVNSAFRTLSKLASLINERIKIINIEYFLGSSDIGIKRKCLKGYQGLDKLLIIIPLYLDRQVDVPKDVPYRNNILILTPKAFINLIGFDTKSSQIFNNVIDFVKSIKNFNDIKVTSLDDTANQCRSEILNKYNYSQKELEFYIYKNLDSYLLKFIPDKSIIDYWRS